jgi:hypothetical protein
MQFGGVNWVAIFVAAAAGFAVGMAWYWIFGKRWMAANGLTEEMCKQGGIRGAVPFIIVVISNVLIAIGLAGIVGHLGIGQVTLRNSIISAVALWLAFVISTLAVNYSFAQRQPVLIAIDGGHWLAVMVVMGVIIGVMGV